MMPFVLVGAAWLAAMLVLSQAGPIGRSPVMFAIGWVLGFGLMALAVRTCPRRWPLRYVATTGIALGLLGRAFFLWSFPVSNDVYRYIWEGFIQNHGFNPYQMAPDHPALAHLIQGQIAPIWQHINHKTLSAAYPPFSMLFFRGLAAVSPSTYFFKTAILIFDLLTLTVLVFIIRQRKVSYACLFWYALNPLVLVYVAGEAHLDIIQTAFLMIGLFAFSSSKPAAGFLAMGMAAISKYFSAAALPFVMQRANRFGWPAVAVIVPFFSPYLDDSKRLLQSLFIFGSQMHYNDGLAEVMRLLLGNAALPVLILLLVVLLSAIYLLEHDMWRSVYLAMGAVLVVLPTLHPWYLLLMVPFMAIYPSRAWLYLMAGTLATLPVLVNEIHTGIFQEIKWIKWLEYGPFYGLLIFDTLRRRPWQSRALYRKPQSVTVIMPVLNEARFLQAAIQSAKGETAVEQIVVVDGGSNDNTRSLAGQTGAEIVAAPRGRGCQVARGVDRARGDVILVLHADTQLAPGAVGRMLDALNEAPSIPGGAFEMTFTRASRKLRWIAFLNNWRARWCGIAFGDQGQFIRKEALETMGGFPDMRLMEDVELSMRMKRFGPPLFVRNGVRVSPRRWVDRNFADNFWKVVSLFLRYLFERRFIGLKGMQTDYYRKYYKNECSAGG